MKMNLFAYFSQVIDMHHTTIFVGPRGQGKLELAGIAANSIGAGIQVETDLKVDTIRNLINDSRTLKSRKLYVLQHAQDMNISSQNALLKMAEEPSKNAYLVLLTENVDKLLPTIRSRAKEFNLPPYSKEQLKEHTDSELLIAVCKNPKQIEELRQQPYGDMYKLCQMIVENITLVSAANVFNITKRAKDYDMDYFLEMLDYTYFKAICETKKADLKRQLQILRKYKNRLYAVSGLNTVNTLDIMFLEMRGE